MQKETYWEDDLPPEGRAALHSAAAPHVNGRAVHASASAPDHQDGGDNTRWDVSIGWAGPQFSMAKKRLCQIESDCAPSVSLKWVWVRI